MTLEESWPILVIHSVYLWSNRPQWTCNKYLLVSPVRGPLLASASSYTL